MGQHVLPGNPPIALTLRRSARARRISLRVSGVDGTVTLTLPRGVTEASGLGFAKSKVTWLRKQLEDRPILEHVAHGTLLPVEGRTLTLVKSETKSFEIDGALLKVPGALDTVPARLLGWLKTRARDRLANASDKFSSQIGRRYTKITLRDTRSRWGSCTQEGGLMYSWRLIMAPPDVLEYVAAHEVAHLVEMNHSPAFWSVVHRLYPGYQTPRRWLREHGQTLHRYRFERQQDGIGD